MLFLHELNFQSLILLKFGRELLTNSWEILKKLFKFEIVYGRKLLRLLSLYLHNYHDSCFVVLLYFQTGTFWVASAFHKDEGVLKISSIWESHKSVCSFKSFTAGSFWCIYTSKASKIFSLLPFVVICMTSVYSNLEKVWLCSIKWLAYRCSLYLVSKLLPVWPI